MKKQKEEQKIDEITVDELLEGQSYKAPIWKVATKPSWTILLRLLIAYILSFVFDSVEILSGTGIYLAIATVEIIYYNYVNNEKNRP